MALTEIELQKAKQLKDQGYRPTEIQEILGAQRAGRKSLVMEEITKRQQTSEELAVRNRTWQDIVAAPAKFLAPGAVDVFSDAIARRSSEAGAEFIDEPTARQYAGAVLQTAGLAADVGITVGSLGAATPLTLGRNVALGAGLGYVYDVGDDLVEQESLTDALTPGFGTAIGGLAPLAFAGIGAGYRALRPAQEAGQAVADDVGRAAVRTVTGTVDQATPAVRQATETAGDKALSGSEEVIRQLGNRFTRAGRHLNSVIDDNASRAALRQNARPAVLSALDEGIDTATITRIEGADDVTRSAYRAVVEAAEGANPKNAEVVAGTYANDMYKIARGRQKEVGEALGNARRALGNDPISEDIYNPAMRTFSETMRNNGIKLNLDGTVEITSGKFIPEEERVIEEIWSRLARYDEMTPAQVDEVMQYLSKLEYRTNVTDKLGGIYIDVVDQKTGQAVPENVFRHIRNTYDSLLEQVDNTGEIAKLRKEYSQVKSVTGRIEDTWLKGIDINKSTDEEIADAMSLALRRLDSRAKSRTTYGQIYRALDKYSRAYGYKGPDASDVSEFYLSTVEPTYAQTTPEASFRGGIFGGVRSALESVVDFGKSNVTDKQRALKGLLDIEDVVPPTVNPAAASNAAKPDLAKNGALEKQGLKDLVKSALADNKGAINPQRLELKRLGVSLSKYNRLRGEALDAMEEFVDMRNLGVNSVETPEDVKRILDNKNTILEALEMKNMNENDVIQLFQDILDDKGKVGKSFNQPATAKTTQPRGADGRFQEKPKD